ncbi:pilus assembly protein [Escherichia coli]|nr:pilus assembly protein [Escherichia coli]
MSFLSKKYEKGLSLIEASMVLALSAIVISGVMFYYQSASDSNKTQNTISELMSTVAAINGLYVGQSNYAGLATKVLASSSAIPGSYKSGDFINNPFGGSVEITPVNGNTAYTIALTGIPQSACLNIASMNLGTSLKGVVVGTVKDGALSTAPVEAPATGTEYQTGVLYKLITPAGASAMCTDKSIITFLMQ